MSNVDVNYAMFNLGTGELVLIFLVILLLFGAKRLPELARGKGNKILNIPGSRLQSREEFVVDYAVIPVGEALVVHSGKRYLVMKDTDLEHYRGERGRRGHKLPRGFQKVDRLDVQGG